MNSANSKAPETLILLIDLADEVELNIKLSLKEDQDTIFNF